MPPSNAATLAVAPTRETTTAVVVVHGIGPQKPGRLVGSVADGLKGFLDRQANRPVDVRRLSDRIEFLYARRRQRRDVVHRVVLLETYWADARLRPGPFRSLAWLVRFGPALIALLFAPDHRDLEHSSAPLQARRRGRRPAPAQAPRPAPRHRLRPRSLAAPRDRPRRPRPRRAAHHQPLPAQQDRRGGDRGGQRGVRSGRPSGRGSGRVGENC